MKQTLKSVVIVGVAVYLTACASLYTETIYLQKDDDKVQCGPYKYPVPAHARFAQEQLRDCVADYQIQGYHRIPSDRIEE